MRIVTQKGVAISQGAMPISKSECTQYLKCRVCLDDLKLHPERKLFTSMMQKP